MAKNSFDFFQDHSLRNLEMALRSDHQALIKSPDGYGKRTGVCGDTVEFYLQVREDAIQDLSFMANGCINTTACCNAIVQLVEGRPVEEAWGITSEDVVAYLETLPADHVHCAELSVGALYLALSNYQELNRASWKKLYQGKF
jgi:nitrogen fixation NifU-like protein